MKRRISLFLVLLLALTMLPAYTALAEGVYAETPLVLPDGYQSPAAMCQTPDGGFAVAARDASGGWALIRWTALGAEPSVLPLKYQGNDIERLSIAPDGSILAGLSFMPGRVSEGAEEGGPVMKQGPVVKGGGAGPSVSDGGNAMDAPSGDNVMNAADNAADATAPDKPGRVIMGPDDLKNTLVWFDPAGAEVSRFEAAGFVLGVQALDGYSAAVLAAQDALAVYDREGKELSRIGLGMVQAAASDGKTLYALEASKLVKYDVVTGDKLGSTDLGMEGSGVLSCSSDGKPYLMDLSGLYELNIDSGEKTQITGSMGMAFGDPTNGVSALAYLQDGSFVALLGVGGGSMGGGRTSIRIGGEQETSLMGYQKRDDIDASQRADFTITALRASTRLQKAASDFQRMHPELNVKLQTQMSIDDPSPVDEHIRTLNTDLLAGKGGDVLVLDALPADKYAQRGILTNLAETFQDVNLLPGVRKAVTGADGSMFYIPAQFSFDLLWGSKAAIGALTSLRELPGIALPDGQTPLFPREYQDLLELFYPASEPLFENGAGKPELDAPAFAEFLDALYALYEGQGELPDENIVKRGGFLPEAILAMMNEATGFFQTQVNNLMNLAVGYTISGGADSAFSPVPTLDGASRGFTPSLMLGIGSQSQNKALAEEFIRLVLSPEVQQLEQMEGLPTVADSLDKLFSDAAQRSRDKNIRMAMAFEGGNPIEMQQPDEGTLTALRALINTLDLEILPDETLMGFIVEECEGFFAGQQDAAATAAAIGQRAWSYLNE